MAGKTVARKTGSVGSRGKFMTQENQSSDSIQNITMLEKRIEDLKWFIGVFSGSVAFPVSRGWSFGDCRV